MAGGHERESPSRKGELTSQKNTQSKEQGGVRKDETANNHLVFNTPEVLQKIQEEQSLYEQDIPHEQLVKAFQELYVQTQQTEGYLPPEVIIRSKLWMKQSNEIRRDFFSPLLLAWDALAYDRYEPGLIQEASAGETLNYHYQASHEPTIKLSDPQIRIIDALAEAVGIPHQKGQTEIEIPEKLRHYEKWVLSEDYQFEFRLNDSQFSDTEERG